MRWRIGEPDGVQPHVSTGQTLPGSGEFGLWCMAHHRTTRPLSHS
jgi:hypothetical protein